MADYDYKCMRCGKTLRVKYQINTDIEKHIDCGGTLWRIWKPTAVIIKGKK